MGTGETPFSVAWELGAITVRNNLLSICNLRARTLSGRDGCGTL